MWQKQKRFSREKNFKETWKTVFVCILSVGWGQNSFVSSYNTPQEKFWKPKSLHVINQNKVHETFMENEC